MPTNAQKLLERAIRAPAGWSINDLFALYKAFDFEITHKGKHDFAQHTKYRQLLATLPRHNKVQ